MRHICVICLSNARNVTYINGRGSFGGFMDFTVVSSWRYMCPFGANFLYRTPMLSSLSWNVGKSKPLKEHRGERWFRAKTPKMLRSRHGAKLVKSKFAEAKGMIEMQKQPRLI